MIPNFFLLGAPKCGTTSMDEWLSIHPAIFMAEKEPHYFNTDHQNRKITHLNDYHALFKGVSAQHVAVGETSVRYLYSEQAVANILRYNADAVFVVMLRNPIEMVYSWHNQVYFSGMEDVKDFERAWNLQSQRQSGQHIPSRCSEVKMLFYGEVCQLGKQLQRLYAQVPSNRVHLVLFDDLIQNPKKTYQSVLQFLNMPDDDKQDFAIHNPSKTYYSYPFNLLLFWLGGLKTKMHINRGLGILEWLRKHNKNMKKRPPLSPKMQQTLAQYFADDIALLERLIERDLRHWLD